MMRPHSLITNTDPSIGPSNPNPRKKPARRNNLPRFLYNMKDVAEIQQYLVRLDPEYPNTISHLITVPLEALHRYVSDTNLPKRTYMLQLDELTVDQLRKLCCKLKFRAPNSKAEGLQILREQIVGNEDFYLDDYRRDTWDVVIREDLTNDSNYNDNVEIDPPNMDILDDNNNNNMENHDPDIRPPPATVAAAAAAANSARRNMVRTNRNGTATAAASTTTAAAAAAADVSYAATTDSDVEGRRHNVEPCPLDTDDTTVERLGSGDGSGGTNHRTNPVVGATVPTPTPDTIFSLYERGMAQYTMSMDTKRQQELLYHRAIADHYKNNNNNNNNNTGSHPVPHADTLLHGMMGTLESIQHSIRSEEEDYRTLRSYYNHHAWLLLQQQQQQQVLLRPPTVTATNTAMSIPPPIRHDNSRRNHDHRPTTVVRTTTPTTTIMHPPLQH
jgi:hypothetical protein